MDWVLMVFSLLACLPMREKPAAGNDSMSQLTCPKCSSEYVKRVSRVGPERLMGLFYYYPFRCQPCGHRFRHFQWGVTYTKIQLDRRTGRKRR